MYVVINIITILFSDALCEVTINKTNYGWK